MSVQCVIVKKETLSTSAAGGGSTTVEGDRVHILYAPFGKEGVDEGRRGNEMGKRNII